MGINIYNIKHMPTTVLCTYIANINSKLACEYKSAARSLLVGGLDQRARHGASLHLYICSAAIRSFLIYRIIMRVCLMAR